jgi:hypothetical protein
MDIHEYQLLTTDDKVSLLGERGTYIDKCAHRHNTVKLYSLENYFVEVAVSNPDEKIVEVSAFQQGARLGKYLNRITIAAN